MIQFGSTSICTMTMTTNDSPCFGMGVEDLTLNGAGISNVGGIQNSHSQERSYVNRVRLVNIAGIGLDIETTGGGQNSGPYSNITFSGYGTSSQCAQILGTGPSRGIHGLTCTGAGGSVGIYLNGTGNSLEDISVSDFTDGILIGKTTETYDVKGNVLINVIGNSDVTNVVHISAASSHIVSDLSILQASRNGATDTILDDGISSTVTDSNVAIYAIGETLGCGASSCYYNRFTTASQSTNVPTWLVGNGEASGSCTSQNGALYSNNSSSGSGKRTLYVCVSGTWTVLE
jgi:hypothetical protein